MTRTTGISARQRELELLGQTVVVIGGSAGIGLETARRARAEGADVILTARNPDRLRHAADELGALGTAAFDAADPAALAVHLMDQHRSHRGDLRRRRRPADRLGRLSVFGARDMSSPRAMLSSRSVCAALTSCGVAGWPGWWLQ